MLDLAINNGFVYDGAGNPYSKQNVGVKNGKIIEISPMNLEDAKTIINAEGLAVSPGFIDIHTHSDYGILVNPTADNKVFQGVTTNVIGNCGSSAGPLMGEAVDVASKNLEPYGLELEWFSIREYFDFLEMQGTSVNIASYVGHSTLRIGVMGFDNRRPTSSELEMMKELTVGSMEEGVFGLSTVLALPPGSYADTSEIMELCEVVTSHGGIYAPHMRGEDERLEEALQETIKISTELGIPSHIAHHKCVGEKNWGKVKHSLKIIENVRSRGIDITCDMYPYTASHNYLKTAIPQWAHSEGDDRLLERISDTETRGKILLNMREMFPEDEFGRTTYIADCPNKRELEGKNVLEIARNEGKSPYDATLDILIDNSTAIRASFHRQKEDDVRTVIASPLSMICSDYGIVPPESMSRGRPHPRAYGSFPKIIGKYAREENLLTVQEALRKMTSAPANRLGIMDRGLIKTGMWADIVVFDKERIIDKATYEEPNLLPTGIEYVIVNGETTVEHGKHTQKLAGKVLKHLKTSP
jgi:N-acyl-D-amino-acid deacylase